METPKIKFHTYLSPEAVKTRGGVIAQLLQSAVNCPKTGFEPYPEMIKDPLPVVFILNGVATIGKNEFFDAMNEVSDGENGFIHISTIDPCREAVRVLLEAEDISAGYIDGIGYSRDIIAAKDDMYRDFLFNVKESWEKYGYGATIYSLGLIMSNIFNGCQSGCKGIFIDSRETATINRIVDALQNAGIIVLKILIIGDRTSREDWKNGCDSNICIDENFYDVVVPNNGDIEHLKDIAKSFGIMLIQACRSYGVSRLGMEGDATFRNRPE